MPIIRPLTHAESHKLHTSALHPYTHAHTHIHPTPSENSTARKHCSTVAPRQARQCAYRRTRKGSFSAYTHTHTLHRKQSNVSLKFNRKKVGGREYKDHRCQKSPATPGPQVHHSSWRVLSPNTNTHFQISQSASSELLWASNEKQR